MRRDDLLREIHARLAKVRDWKAISNPQAFLFAVANAVLKEQRLRERRQAPPSKAHFELVLRQLQGMERAVVVLHFWHNLDLEKIADRLSVSRQQVRRVLLRALAKIRASPAFRDLRRERAESEPVWPDVAYEFLEQLQDRPAFSRPVSTRRRLYQACLPVVIRVAVIVCVALLSLTTIRLFR